MDEVYASGEEDVDVNAGDSDVDEGADVIRDLTAISASVHRTASRARINSRRQAARAQDDDEDDDDDLLEEESDEEEAARLAALDAAAEPLRRNSDRLKLLSTLPYGIETLEDMDRMVEHAMLRVQQCLYLKDKQAGFVLWHERIMWLLQSRYPLKPSVHIRLIKIYYHLAILPTAPGVESLTSEACRCCVLLLASKKLSANDLILPWRPLYDRFYREVYPSARQRDMLGVGGNDALKAYYEELTLNASRFFARDGGPRAKAVVKDMLGVILAKMDGTDATWSALAFQLATNFLPRHLAHHWFHSMFRIWQTINSGSATRRWYRVLGEVAQAYSQDAIKTPLKAREGERSVGFFTEHHFKVIMTTVLREISPASRNANDSTLALVEESKEAINYLARAIVFSLAADGPDGSSTALSYFLQFLTSVESKFHPLYGGVGQLQVSLMAHYLLSVLVDRVYAERKSDCEVPAAKRLTKGIVDTIAERLSGLVFMSLFSKQTEAADACQGALLKIAVLRPDLVIPQLLERSYQGLQALETSDRTQPIMKSLSLLAATMLKRTHYKGGAQHLIPLLHLCLPGIDANDPYKTINTGLLIVMLVHGARIEDLTLADKPGDRPSSPIASRDGAGGGGGAEMMLDGDAAPEAGAAATDEHPMDVDPFAPVEEVDEEAVDEAIRMGTAGAEDWVVSFFRQTLNLFASLADEGAKGQSVWETEVQAATALIAAASYLCQSLSAPLFDVALDVVVEFVASTPSANCVKQIGQLMAAFARVDPGKVLHKVLPICNRQIRYELSTGAGSSFSTSTTSTSLGDTSLNWYLSILGGLVSNAGGAGLLRYAEPLRELIAHAAEACRAERSYYLLSRVLVKLLLSLTTVYPSEERFVAPEEWESSEFRQHSFRSWGKTYSAGSVAISWHVPSDAEIAFALQLIGQFGSALLDEVTKLLRAPVEKRRIVWSNAFCSRLTLARAVFTGIPALIELPQVHDGAPISDLDSECPDFFRAWTPIKAHFVLRDPSDARSAQVLAFRQQFSTTVAEAASQLQEAGGNEHLDDSRVILKCISSALLHYAFTEELTSPNAYCDQYLLGAAKWEKHQKDFPRIWWIRMAYRHHRLLQRLRAVRRRRTALDDALLQQLIKFTQSEYRSIRMRSQGVFAALSNNHSGYRVMSMPLILDALQVSAPKHRIKGAIHLLSLDFFSGWLSFHNKFLPQVFDGLMSLQDHADHKVQELASNAAEVIFEGCGQDNQSFFGINLGPVLTKMVTKAAQSSAEDAALLEIVEADVRRRTQVQTDVFAQLRDSALRILDDERAHWTFAFGALRMLGLLDRVYEPVDAAVVGQMAELLIDPNPAMCDVACQLLSRLLYYIKIRTLTPSREALAEYRKKQPLSHVQAQALPVAPGWFEERIQRCREPLTTESKLDESALQDGWLIPGGETIYFKCRTGPALVWEEGSQDAIEALREYVTSKEWWLTFVQRNAEDKEKTGISLMRVLLCKGLTEIYGPIITEALTYAVEQIIEEDASDRANHRAAAEIIIGHMRGIKTWKLEEQAVAWSWFKTFLPPLFKSLSNESADVWTSSLTVMMGNRDPRRNMPVIDFVLEQLRSDFGSDDEQSVWEQSKAHFMTTSLLYALGSKSYAWADELTEAILPKMQAKYAAVTQIVGVSLADVDMLRSAPRLRGVTDLLEACEDGFGTLIKMKDHLRARLQGLFDQWELLLPERTPPVHGTLSAADRLGFAILSWATKIMNDHRNTELPDVLLDFGPQIRKLFELRDNRELSASAISVILRVSQPLHSSDEMLDRHFRRLIELHRSADSWQTRVAILTVINVTFLRSTFLCSPEISELVLDTTVQSLQDEHVDVRSGAARDLTLLVMQHHRSSIPRLIKLFVQQTQTTVLPHKSDAGYGEAMRKLHGALLGAGALVSAFPTSVPDWMGNLIVQTLASHDEDPAPIGPSVRRVAAQFKETHEMYREGSWDEHVTHFTEDELAVLHDWTLGRAADYIA